MHRAIRYLHAGAVSMYEFYAMGPFLNYVVSVGGRGQKSLILHSKKMTKRGEGVKNRQF